MVIILYGVALYSALNLMGGYSAVSIDLNPFAPKTDKHVTSPLNINTLWDGNKNRQPYQLEHVILINKFSQLICNEMYIVARRESY